METSKIPFAITETGKTVVVEVTNVEEEDELLIEEDVDPPTEDISIPKTGDAPPYANYLMATVCLVVAAVGGGMLYRMRMRQLRKR